MLVRSLHYSANFPDGGHKEGDIFDITKNQAEYFTSIGWVEILPQEWQPEVKRGKKKKAINIGFATDLSKSLKINKGGYK